MCLLITMQELKIAARYNIGYCAKIEIKLEISAKLGNLMWDICIDVYRLVKHTVMCVYARMYIFSVKCVQVMKILELSTIYQLWFIVG